MPVDAVSKAMRLSVFAIIILTFLGAGLRLHTLFHESIHVDEALFGSWARLIGTGMNPLLSGEMVDKPPLLFYVQAVLYPVLGTPTLWVARIPGLAASVMCIPLVARLIWNVYGDDFAAVLAAGIVALSPLLVSYGARALIDPVLGVLVLASLVGASRVRGGQEGEGFGGAALFAGLFLGLSLVTKYQAVLFVPLHLVILWWQGGLRYRIKLWLAGVTLPLVAMFAWLLVRGQGTDLWGLQMSNFGGLRMARSWEIWSRLEGWGEQWQQVIGSPVLLFFLLLMAPIFVALLIQRQDRETAFDQLFLLFVVGYALVHWVVAVPVWDRYLIAPAPLVAILLGRYVSRVVSFLQPASPVSMRFVAPMLVAGTLLMMAPMGVADRDGPDGGVASDVGQEAAMVADALANAPYGTVLYDHWYSWYWRFYLLDSKVHVSWFAHPDALVGDLEVFHDGGDSRYVVLPGTEEGLFVRRFLLAEGYQLEVVTRSEGMILYRIVL